MNKRGMVLILTVGGLLGACNDARTEEDKDETQLEDVSAGELRLQPVPNAIDELTPGKPATGDQPTIDPGLQLLVDLATEDLIAKEGIAATQVEVLQAAYVSWSDSSMGCPPDVLLDAMRYGEIDLALVVEESGNAIDGIDVEPWIRSAVDFLPPSISPFTNFVTVTES